MKTFDFLYCTGEPGWKSHWAAQELSAAGLIRQCIGFDNRYVGLPPDSTMDMFKDSDSDAIFFMAPYFFSNFIHAHADEFKALGKPLVHVVFEESFAHKHPIFPVFARGHLDFFTHYFCAHESDVAEFSKTAPASLIPLWVAASLMPAPLPRHNRLTKAVFVGTVGKPEWGTTYIKRRSILERLDNEGYCDWLQIPNCWQTAPAVASLYGSYAAVVSPPAPGSGHSIRAYEATAMGALLVEVQREEAPESEKWFKDGVHCIELPASYGPNEVAEWFKSVKFYEHAAIAEAGMKHCRENFGAVKVFGDMLAKLFP